jgi:hypothetical protein
LIEIEKLKSKLILKYYSDFNPSNWVDEKLKSKDNFTLQAIFKVNRKILSDRIQENFDEPEFYFIIGELVDDDYYKIDKFVLGLKNNFFFHKSIELGIRHFLVKSRISLLSQIDKYLSEDIYIGGEKEEKLPYQEFERLIQIFPNSHEVNLYRQAKVTSIIKTYFDNIEDKEKVFNNYLNKKIIVNKSELRKTFKESDILKYETILEKLKDMLINEISYSEKQWQEEISQIILLLFPKYIAIIEEMEFKDIYNDKKRRLDFGLIDFMGNLDLVELKIPFDKSIVSVSQYRENHIPNRDLSGSIMQIEKYIYYLNKSGIAGEKKLTEKYKHKLPENLEIKINNPNGIIIMGRENSLNKGQLADFEIIKRKYKNIIDIFTYDDLIRRIEIVLNQLRRI